MAATGEPYSVAARNRGASGPSGAGQDAVRDVIACANRTLTASSARIEARSDAEVARGREWQGRRPGLIGRLVRRAARGALERVAPGTDAAELWEAFLHQVGDGFVEPAADRYLVDYGGYAQMLVDGRRFSGRSGEPLGPRYENRQRQRRQDDPLDLLRLVQGVTHARYAGAETVRGTPCRLIAAASGSAEFTVWIDDEHVRRIQTVERSSGASSGSATTSSAPTSAPASAPTVSATSAASGVSKTETLELWDFGVPVDSLDWSRLPSFRTVR